MKKVLVISTSLRPRSNSEALADEFVRGAQEAGNEVEKVTLRGKDIRFCKGCLVCQKTQECVIKDDDVEAPSRAITGLGGWIACFEHAHLAGTVFAGGVTDMGEIEGHPSLKSAYLLGKSVR